MDKLNKKIVLIVIAIIVFVLLLAGATVFLLKEKNNKQEIASSQRIKEKAINYINKNILAGKAVASITNISKEHDLYKIKLKIQNNEFDSYISKDGVLLFPQIVDLDVPVKPEANIPTSPTPTPTPTSIPNSTK
ncbi:hypothetical protein CVV26_01205 [Candidatus Kuenenbacteria bacterium HGW-Kuenenbacteria-1]|uniref:Uncharacterized protein n=1 Tax=Candidatus Kuenenbacteria bacterium HGW-Kuenenbacteria-1 TaxID=2013812 RepID=A0A2N1UP26_9BACT|nr:MAG: hypothetical protein CVV26_01205 [Candidatus Kuenenbacteria bacterium HGW-Kuenenbacteria-1]